MSGIAGIWRRGGAPVFEGNLIDLADALERYGSGSPGYYCTGPMGLVQTMHRTTPEAVSEVLPLISPDGHLAIVADARLDNRPELLARLGLVNQPTPPDSQIILAAYQRWGEDCASALLGDFAFAIWDGSKQQFYCARDIFGVRPFYYFTDQDLFAFATALRGILSIDEVPRILNEDKITDFLFEMFEDKARTFYRDVWRLPPAHWMTVSREGKHISRYWAPDPTREIRLPSDTAYAEAYRDLFVEAVRCRLRSNLKIGSALSGGLDSSSVTCVAGHMLEQTGQALATFSVVFDSVPQSDEREYMQAVLDEGSYQPHFIAGDQLNPISDLLGLIAEEEEPYYSPQMFLNRGMWATASNNGVEIFLEGLMGDNVVSHGYGWLNELGRQWRWLALYRQFKDMARLHPDPMPALTYMTRAFWQDGIKSHAPQPVIQLWQKLRGNNQAEHPVLPLFINKEFAQRVNLEERLHNQALLLESVKTARRQHYLDLEYGLIPTAMEIYAAEASRFRIEPRFPFLDRRLVEFSLAVPPEQKIGGGFTRRIARQGLAEFLPKKIQLRPDKANLGWNFVRGLKAEKLLVERILTGSPPVVERFLDLSAVRVLAHQATGESPNRRAAHNVFLSVALVAWFESGGVQKSYTGKELSLSKQFINVS